MQHPLDRLLVETWLRARDESTFRLLYMRHAKAMWRLALRLTKGREEVAEEIVQDAWLRAVERLEKFKWQSSLRTWLCGIVVFRWREQVRKENFENQKFQPLEEDISASEKSNHPATKLDLASAFDALPDTLKEVLTLHDLEGFKHREIAAMLSIAEGTSKSRLSHARKAFRAFFEKATSWLF